MKPISIEQVFSYFSNGDNNISKEDAMVPRSSLFDGFFVEENMTLEEFESKNLEAYKKYEEAVSKIVEQEQEQQLPESLAKKYPNALKTAKQPLGLGEWMLTEKEEMEKLQKLELKELEKVEQEIELEKEELEFALELKKVGRSNDELKKITLLKKQAEKAGVNFENWEYKSMSVTELSEELELRKGQIPLIKETLEFLKSADGDKYKIAELLNEKLYYNNRKTRYAYHEVCKEAFGEGYWGIGVGTGTRQGYIYYNIRTEDGKDLHIGYAMKDKKAFREYHYGVGRSSYE